MLNRSLKQLLEFEPSGEPELDRLVWPVFVYEDHSELQRELAKLPQQKEFGLNPHGRVSFNTLSELERKLHASGVSKVTLYGVPKHREVFPKCLEQPDFFVLQALERLKGALPSVEFGLDLCVCQFIPSGHCRVVRDGVPTVEETKALLFSHAEHALRAGASFLMPSGMLENFIGPLKALIRESNHPSASILSQSAKFVSQLYGPFQQVAHAQAGSADKSSYQLPATDFPAAFKRLEQESHEGADFVFVKPSICYLELLRDAALKIPSRVGAFITSGESALFSQVAFRRGVSAPSVRDEAFSKLFRAGAALLVSHQAFDYVQALSTNHRRLSV